MLEILKETKDYIVVSKPSGLITEKNPFEDSLENRVSNHFSKSKSKPFVGVVHRLDKVTSGLVLFAKKKSALIYFNQLFETKKIQKTYLALVQKPEQISHKKIKLNHFLEKDLAHKKAIIKENKFGKSKTCELSFQLTKENNDISLVKVWPKTGRFHQIRAQLSFIGMPIIGDIKYGHSIEINQNQHICLHAYSLSFIDFNSDEKITIVAPIPQSKYWNIFA